MTNNVFLFFCILIIQICISIKLSVYKYVGISISTVNPKRWRLPRLYEILDEYLVYVSTTPENLLYYTIGNFDNSLVGLCFGQQYDESYWKYQSVKLIIEQLFNLHAAFRFKKCNNIFFFSGKYLTPLKTCKYTFLNSLPAHMGWSDKNKYGKIYKYFKLAL